MHSINLRNLFFLGSSPLIYMQKVQFQNYSTMLVHLIPGKSKHLPIFNAAFHIMSPGGKCYDYHFSSEARTIEVTQ